MSVTAGALSKTLIGSSTASLSSAAATGGTGPYTYQWYRGATTGFTAAASTAVAGATSLTLVDTGLTPSTTYFYKVIALDTGAGSATSTSASLEVDTAVGNPNINSFAQSNILGAVDQAFNYNTRAVQIDTSSAGGLKPGQAVKIVDNGGGVPKVVECSANSDNVFGFINYNFKNVVFNAGDRCEISQKGNVLYLTAVGAISRGVQVQLDLSYIGGVKTKTGSSGACVVGYAYDNATLAGQLLRVTVDVPSFTVA